MYLVGSAWCHVLEQYIPEDKEVKFMTIPKKTTSFIQPFLDVFGFRIWKNFVRTSDNVILQEKDINLHSRNDILGVQLCFRRFSIDGFSGKGWSK